jgi:hypothetical protein
MLDQGLRKARVLFLTESCILSRSVAGFDLKPGLLEKWRGQYSSSTDDDRIVGQFDCAAFLIEQDGC